MMVKALSEAMSLCVCVTLNLSFPEELRKPFLKVKEDAETVRLFPVVSASEVKLFLLFGK